MESFISDKTAFVAEQAGVPEDELKRELVELFRGRESILRAYLAEVKYGKPDEFNVALCVASAGGEDQELAGKIASIFRRMFGAREHLDVIFLRSRQEAELRKVSCPFYSASRIEQPDFYLTSSEHRSLKDVYACYKTRRLTNGHPDGYMLCEIKPAIVGQPYRLGAEDLDYILIASRHAGHSIFAVAEWPVYVHVARVAVGLAVDQFTISKNDIETIGWAEIYDSSQSASASHS